MIERLLRTAKEGPYKWFYGNWDLFLEVVRNPSSKIVLDADGILVNSTKPVFTNYERESGVKVKASEIDRWDFLTEVSKRADLPQDKIDHAEDGWFDANVLGQAKKYPFMKLAVDSMISHAGAENVYVLTSRNPNLRDSTERTLFDQYPKILPENLLIRQNKYVPSNEFKAGCLWWLAQTAPSVIFIDDSQDFIKAALDAKIPNLLAINIPQGVTWPGFSNENLVVIKRYPQSAQSLIPFWYYYNKALGKLP